LAPLCEIREILTANAAGQEHTDQYSRNEHTKMNPKTPRM
jgi:hypothetical protein